MIVQTKEKQCEVREKMRDGEGSVTFVHHLAGKEVPNCRLFADLTLPEGASIGLHTHLKETEFYLIRSGQGIVTEADGEKNVMAGDVVVTGDTESHSIRNSGKEPLVFTAVIISEG